MISLDPHPLFLILWWHAIVCGQLQVGFLFSILSRMFPHLHPQAPFLRLQVPFIRPHMFNLTPHVLKKSFKIQGHSLLVDIVAQIQEELSYSYLAIRVIHSASSCAMSLIYDQLLIQYQEFQIRNHIRP